jgi:hypothetical protein
MEVIEVIWIDSCASNHNWLMMEDIKNWTDVEPLTIHTFGVKVQEDDNYIVIAQSYTTDPEQCCNLMSIPKGCIKKIYVLEETVTRLIS